MEGSDNALYGGGDADSESDAALYGTESSDEVATEEDATMTEGEDSRTSIKESNPEEIFVCGSIIEFEGRKWRIRAIHTGRGRTLTGRREASQIRRIYLHPPPEPRRRFRRN